MLPSVLARLPAGRRALAAPLRDQLEAAAALTLLLRQAARDLTARFAAAGLPARIVKGPAFADRLYKAPCWRPFTDLDLLLRRGDLPAAAAVMCQAGYRPEALELKHAAESYGEEKWVASPGGAEILVELHWDMIGSPTLRRGRRADYDLFEGAEGASLLLQAAVHAAYGHAFDRLQPLVDVVQATRALSGTEQAWLAERARVGGLLPGLSLALDLAARAFGEPACTALARDLALPRPPALIRRLMTPALVVEAGRQSWRRQAVREWLKKAGRQAG